MFAFNWIISEFFYIWFVASNEWKIPFCARIYLCVMCHFVHNRKNSLSSAPCKHQCSTIRTQFSLEWNAMHWFQTHATHNFRFAMRNKSCFARYNFFSYVFGTCWPFVPARSRITYVLLFFSSITISILTF